MAIISQIFKQLLFEHYVMRSVLLSVRNKLAADSDCSFPTEMSTFYVPILPYVYQLILVQNGLTYSSVI